MTPVTHRGRRRLEREQPVERLRGLLDDDLLAAGHELPPDDRSVPPGLKDGAQDDDRAGRHSSSPEEAGETGAAGTDRSLREPGTDDEPWVSPIRARLPWATLLIAGAVVVAVVLSLVLRGGQDEAVVASPPATTADDSAPFDGPTAAGTASPPQPGSAQTAPAQAQGPVTVHVVGEVAHPGVVELPDGGRISDAVEAAGGLNETAVVDAVNMAAPVVDGTQIVIPDQQLADQWKQATPVSGGTGGAPGGSGAGRGAESPGRTTGPAGQSAPAGSDDSAAPGGAGASGGAAIDLNTASAAELEELPKVGPVLAQRIIEHRDQIGGFRSVEELDDVSGIGPAMMEAIAPLVTV